MKIKLNKLVPGKLKRLAIPVFGMFILTPSWLSVTGQAKGIFEEESALVIYCGRSKHLVGPLIEKFKSESGIEVKVRYGKTAEMAAMILEEGNKSPADLFFAQDAGALGAVAKSGLLSILPASILNQVDSRFRSPKALWVGVSGRARVVVFNTEKLTEKDLPDDIFGFCDPKWKGRIGWAPLNGSFQAFVTAIRRTHGDERAREWLSCIQANKPRVYPKNSPIVAAAGSGEIDVGFVNHYYLYRFIKEFGEKFSARNYHLPAGKAGNLINVAGISILKSAKKRSTAENFINFLLRLESQQYFSNTTYEYPLAEGAKTNPLVRPLKEIDTPDIDLSDLDDLNGTLKLLQELEIL
jgi:iron(III) transport system substrate-binding protein